MVEYSLKLRQRNIPESTLISDLKRVAEIIGKQTVTKIEYDQHGNYGATTILRRFNTWNKALSKSGLLITSRQNIPDEELFENIASVWQALGRQPVGKDLARALGRSSFALGTYEKRFGSWNNALLSFIAFIQTASGGLSERGAGDDYARELTRSGRTPRKINWRLRATVLIRDNCICKMCGASPSKDAAVTLHVDHIRAWTNGGETVLPNLQTLCSVCNVGKSNVL